jgi:hypothetical protein
MPDNTLDHSVEWYPYFQKALVADKGKRVIAIPPALSHRDQADLVEALTKVGFEQPRPLRTHIAATFAGTELLDEHCSLFLSIGISDDALNICLAEHSNDDNEILCEMYAAVINIENNANDVVTAINHLLSQQDIQHTDIDQLFFYGGAETLMKPLAKLLTAKAVLWQQSQTASDVGQRMMEDVLAGTRNNLILLNCFVISMDVVSHYTSGKSDVIANIPANQLIPIFNKIELSSTKHDPVTHLSFIELGSANNRLFNKITLPMPLSIGDVSQFTITVNVDTGGHITQLVECGELDFKWDSNGDYQAVEDLTILWNEALSEHSKGQD